MLLFNELYSLWLDDDGEPDVVAKDNGGDDDDDDVHALDTAQERLDCIRDFVDQLRGGRITVKRNAVKRMNAMITAEVVDDVVSRGDVTAVLDAMQQFPTDLKLQNDALSLLVTVCNNINDPASVGQQAILVTLAAMRNHKNDVDLLDTACLLIAFFCENTDYRNKVVESGGVELVMDVVTKFSKNLDIQSTACYALMSLTDKYKIAINKAAERHVIKHTMRLLRKVKGVDERTKEVIRATLGVVSNVAEFPENHADIVVDNGIKLVLDIMNNHPTDVVMQQNGTGVIEYLSSDVNHLSTIISLGGVQSVLNAMTNAADDATVQCNACGTIKNIASINAFNSVEMHELATKLVIKAANFKMPLDDDCADLSERVIDKLKVTAEQALFKLESIKMI